MTPVVQESGRSTARDDVDDEWMLADVEEGRADTEISVRNRDFGILSFSSSVSQLGSMGVGVANPLLALALTRSPVFASFVAAANLLPGLILHLPAGLVVDRVDRRTVMWVSQSIRVIVVALLCIGLEVLDRPAPLLLVAALLDGSCEAFYNIAEIAAIQHIAPRRSLGAAMGRNEAYRNIALIAGRPLGGALFGINRTLPYAVDALTSAVPVIVIMGLMRTKRFQDSEADPSPVGASKPSSASVVSQAPHRGRPMAAMREGLGVLRKDRFLSSTLIACTIANFLFQIVALLLIVMAEKRNMSSTRIGLLLSMSGIGGFAGALVAPRIPGSGSPRRTLLICVLLWVPLTWIVAAKVRQPVIGMMAWGLCSFVGAHINVALSRHQTMNVPGSLQGRVAGINRFMTTGAVGLGALLAGSIISTLGHRTAAMAAASGIGVVAFLLTGFLLYEFRSTVLSLLRSALADLLDVLTYFANDLQIKAVYATWILRRTRSAGAPVAASDAEPAARPTASDTPPPQTSATQVAVTDPKANTRSKVGSRTRFPRPADESVPA